MTAFDYFVQGIGFASLILSLLSFQAKKRPVILLLQTLASLLFSCQLFLLPGGLAGGWLDLIACVRTLTFALLARYVAEGKKWASSPLIPTAFMLAMIAVGAMTWEGGYTLLAILGSLLSTLALFMKRERNIRLISLLVGPCWFTYNLIVGSYSGAINEVVAVTSIIIGIIRHDIPKKKTENLE